MALLLSLDVSVMCYRNANLIISSSLKKKKTYWLLISLSLIQVFMNSVDHCKIVQCLLLGK